MSLCIALKCDACAEGSQTRFQEVRFDAVTETYGDLLAAIPTLGWRIEMSGIQVERATCSACIAKETA